MVKNLLLVLLEILLMQFFEPVTWRDQSSPFFYVLACKTRKTRRGLAGEASSDDQVSPVSKEEVRRREDLLEIIDLPLIILILPFILIHVICPFYPRQAQGSTWTFSKVGRNIP
jgi:hypothetical protein